MAEVIGLGIAMVFAGYLVFHRTPERLPRNELSRFQRLSDEMRRSEIHPFE